VGNLRRLAIAILGTLDAANGVVMLVDPAGWFARIPGAGDTGPFNPHFVYDVGLAFLASGVALVVFAWRPALRPAGLCGASFPALHALLHLFDLASGHSHHVAADLLLVVLPSALTVALVWPTAGLVERVRIPLRDLSEERSLPCAD
jgi:hypothetical protein